MSSVRQQVGHPGTGARQRRAAQRHEGGRGGERSRPRRPAPGGNPLPRDTHHRQRTKQRAGVECARPSVVGVGEPLEGGGTPAEQRNRVAAPGVAERQIGQVTGRDAGRTARTHRRKHAASVSQSDVLER